MDYPVLVNPGKPSKSGLNKDRMKKKKAQTPLGPQNAEKPARRPERAPAPYQQAAAARPAAPNDSRPAVRR